MESWCQLPPDPGEITPSNLTPARQPGTRFTRVIPQISYKTVPFC